MTLAEAQIEISSKSLTAGDTAKPIWEVCYAICVAVQAIDERTKGGLPADETVEVLKAKIVSLNRLLDNDAKIFQQIKDIVGGDPTVGELPGIIEVIVSHTQSTNQ